MSNDTVNLQDKYVMREKLSVGSLRGEVSIYENQNGKLGKLLDKKNTIVYGGRNWLLKKAFGTSLEGNESELYSKQIRFFGVGVGGESGNLLQAGASYAYETSLKNQIRLRSDLEVGNPGYDMYGSNDDGTTCYYKEFSSINIREDKSLPYSADGINIQFPQVIAEIRIDLSSGDASTDLIPNDINEAALFASTAYGDPVSDGSSSSGALGTLGSATILSVEVNGDYAIYYLDTNDLDATLGHSLLNVGDSIWVEGSSPNNISETAPLTIIEKNNGTGVTKASIVVDRTGTIAVPSAAGTIHFINKLYDNYVMFSRVCFSTIRKTTDRQITFIWRLYF